ncbi:MAG: T9SS type A sorting domain-containing protein, partial [Bacteroidota bacterium]
LSTIFVLSYAHSFSQNAPITTAGSVQVCPDSLATIPVTVDNFTFIGSISLRLDYDPTFLTFSTVTNINPALAIAGVLFNDVPVSGTLHKIMIVWTDINADTLANGSKLFDILLTYLSGAPSLSFNNTANNGSDCEYANGSGFPLNDIPTSTYYIDGQVSGIPLVGAAGTISGTATVCQGQTGVGYSVPVIPNATGYAWSVPTGATIVSGINSSIITVDFSASASSGNITVYGTNSCGNGIPSPAYPVTVVALPGPGGTITGTATVQQGQTGVQYSTSPIANATGYTWSVPSGATIVSGTNSTTITVDFSPTASSGNITVYGTNACGNGPTAQAFPVTVVMATQLELTDITIPNGTTICYDATQTIILAGNGTFFTVENGGSVTLIAGLNILMLPGTTVQPGGYMWAYITTTGQYCGPTNSPVYPVAKNEITKVNPEEFIPVTKPAVPQCKIYPNPTTGNFTLELTGLAETASVQVEAFSIMGEKIFTRVLSGTSNHVFSISERPSGLYFVKVTAEGSSQILKVVKQ